MLHRQGAKTRAPKNKIERSHRAEVHGYTAEGLGFYLWYDTRAEVEGWRRELALDEPISRDAGGERPVG